MANSPVVLQLPRVVLDEGSSVRMIAPDGKVTEFSTTPHVASVSLKRDELLQGKFDLVSAASELGKAVGTGMEREVFNLLKDASPSVGGTFNSEDIETFREQFIERLEGIEVSFDDDKPSLVVVVSPTMAERWSDIDTTEFRNRVDKIIERKRHDWVSRETHRRLAD